MNQLNLFEKEQTCDCSRCGAKCRVDPVANSKARMVKRSNIPKGLCINCAVHDTLRHLYPANLLLASSGPKSLAFPHIQEQFAALLKIAHSDAMPGEINWNIIIENWDLLFQHKLKRTATNPVSQEDLDRAAKEGVPLHGQIKGKRLLPVCATKEQREKAIRRIFPDGEIVIE